MAQMTTLADTAPPRKSACTSLPRTEKVPPNVMKVTVKDTGLNIFIPTIPEVQKSNILQQFKIKDFTEIEERPSFNAMQSCERELGQNTLVIKVPFEGSKRGCLGLVYSNKKYVEETGGGDGRPKNGGGEVG